MEVSGAYYKPLSDSAGGEEMVSVRGINPRVITSPHCGAVEEDRGPELRAAEARGLSVQ